MDVYRKKILRGYLDKDPNYVLPSPPPIDAVIEVKSLKPTISNVELFCHIHPRGRELAVVVKGDHFWFSRAIEIEFDDKSEKIEIAITAENVSQKQIECTHTLDEDSDLYRHCTDELQVVVSVESQFTTSVRRKRITAIFKNLDPISFRQSQLAKQTPSEIIILAFLSALLEQPPPDDSGSRPTKRYNFITKFFQESARIVPMESIFFAIANCQSNDTALKCANAFIQNIKPTHVPASTLSVEGCERAAVRLRHIVAAHDFQTTFLHRTLRQPHSTYHDGQKLYSEATAGIVTPVKCLPPKASILARIFSDMANDLKMKSHAKMVRRQLNVVSGRNIGEVYPISKALQGHETINALAPLPDILKTGRNIVRKLAVSQMARIGSTSHNDQMLRCVNSIIENNLEPCVAMLGGFMEQQIRLPLIGNPFDTALALTALDDSEAVGVWALFALKSEDILQILSTSKNQSLVVQIAKFIQGIFNRKTGEQPNPKQDMNYAGKLQFLIGAMNETVTCGSQYISYSLERELVSLCKRLKITTSTKFESLLTTWDDKFKDTALHLVPEIHRPLLARWLLWALSIHRLRDGLARYTTIGVIGLVNSGKSTLVKRLFTTRAVAGTTQCARTTVPLIYNMEASVEGLSIIDFPGVDDRDSSIPGLAKILVELAQVVLFLCSYDRFHTKSAGDWMEHFKHEFGSIPVLVCLTHADKLYEETFKEEIPTCHPEKVPHMKELVRQEVKTIVGEDAFDYSEQNLCKIKFCSLLQNDYSPLNCPEGRESMTSIGIFTVEVIGQWIQEMLKSHLQQPELAERLGVFFAKNCAQEPAH